MVEWAGRYYSELFQGSCGVTQRDHLSSTILNMVVDALIWHWVMLVTGE